MSGKVLAILLWKHLIVRKRKYIRTPIEFLAPILIIILIFVFRHDINPIPRHQHYTELNDVDETQPFTWKDVGNPSIVLYTPETPKTLELMKLVNEKFSNNSRRLTTFLPFDDLSTVFNITKNLQYDEAIVIFQNVSGDTWPETLNYTIRMKNDFLTAIHTSLDNNPSPHRSFGEIYGQFMALQWAIDTSYLELLTGKEVKLNVTLQEFPYVKHRGSSNSSMIADWMRTVCWLSMLLPFMFLMTRLLEERATGIQELMKMMGVQTEMLSLAHVINALAPGLVFAAVTAILLTVGDNPLLVYASGFIIFVTLMFYYFTVISLAFATSYLTKSTQYAVSLSVLAYVVLWIPAMQVPQHEVAPPSLVALAGLLPHMPLTWLWTEVAQLEKYGQALSFGTMFTSHSTQSGSVFAAIVLMLCQTIFFFLLSWYLDHVYPGQYGQSLPWNFICQKQYWRKNDVTPDELLEELEEVAEQDQRYFEPEPIGQEVGIKIMNVSKVFPKHRALHNVSLEVHKGEITVLLGHNGAGKTTLMNIITGMLSATQGKVFVNGADVTSQRSTVRQHLGLCPQHNLFFPDLTVLEHVMFFTLLKGGTFAKTRISSESLLDKLGILDKKNSMSSELSGGMKRRLQLACALAGSADVLILDEPTSGLDVETRRELWDLLLALRGTRTVLLSTHFMEEADALGDRVAALHSGRLRCFATPLYLKKAIGTGYRLTFTTIGTPKQEAITRAVTSHVPDANLKEATINSISYNLPAASSDKFPQLFTGLENQRSELGIDSIGVGASTLEEVFLRLCSDVDTTLTQDDVDGVGSESERTVKRVTGFLLYLRQFKVLFKRQLNYVIYKKMWFLILQVILPLLMIVAFTLSSNSEKELLMDKLLPLNLDVYRNTGDRRVLYSIHDAPLRALTDRYPDVLFQNTSDVAEAVVRFGRQDVLDYHKYLIGIELNDTDAKVLYTTTVRHAAPIGLNLLSNLVAARLLPWATPTTIVTNNHPIHDENPFRDPRIVEPKNLTAAVLWAVTVVFIILASNLNGVSLPCKERASGARHLHVMCGAPAALVWAAALLHHAALALATALAPAAALAALLDRDRTFTEPAFILTLLTTLLVGSMAFFAFMYLVSFYFAERGSSIILVIALLLFGLVLPGVKLTKDMFKTDQSKSLSDILLATSKYMMPPHTLTVAVSQAALTARLNALCSLNRDKCPGLMVAEHGFDPDKCCASTGNVNCYFCCENNAPGLMIALLAVQIIVYMTLVWMTEVGVFSGVYERVMNARYRPPPATRHPDEMARAERAYVTKAIALPTKQIPDAMLVSDLHKNYRFLNKSFPAVKGISFSVKKGECFGLLGVNGAGKSTTFQMLTGERCPTRGQVYANGHYLKGISTKYLNTLGYCPQFFGLDEFQTGMQNLELTLTLRGLDTDAVKSEAASWIQVVGLQKYADRLVGGYSGGCMRRLAAAAALCSGAPLTLLDEPTAGVDVAARRRVWAALRRAMTRQRAIIITSHSMDEMEALCGRIAIMSGGEVCALGSPAALRAAHAAGHAVRIKLAARRATAPGDHDETDSPNSQLKSLKGKLHQKFDCTLKDEHKTMLHYHINETMQYSELFRELEALRVAYPLVEDYSVTETTLEEVFLSFARTQPSQLSRPV